MVKWEYRVETTEVGGTVQRNLDKMTNIGQYQNAINDYTKAIQLDPSAAMSYNNRGWSYSKLGQYQNAINDYTKAIQLDPSAAKSYNNRSWAYYYLGQYTNQKADEAMACSLDSKHC